MIRLLPLLLLLASFSLPAAEDDNGCGGRFLSLSLKDILAGTYTGQPQLISSRQDVVKAQSNLLSAKSPFLPSATASLSGEKFTSVVPGGAVTAVGSAVVGGTGRYANYPSVGINWNVYSGGRDLAAYRQAQGGLSASEFDLTNSLNDTLVSVLTAYGELMKAHRSVETEEILFATQKKILQRNEDLYRQGRISLIKLSQARISLSQSERSQYQVCQSLSEKSGALAKAMGIRVEADQILRVDDPLPDSNALKLNETNLGSIADEDPKVKSAKEKVAVAQKKIDQAKGALYPTVTLNARYDWLGQNQFSFSQAFNTTTANSYRIGFFMQQPLGPFTNELAGISSARADLAKAEAAYTEALIDAQNRLKNTLSAKTRAERAAKSAEDSAQYVTQNMMLTEQLFSRGMADLDTVDQSRISMEKEKQYAFELSIDAQLSRWLAFRVLYPLEFAPALLQKGHADVGISN